MGMEVDERLVGELEAMGFSKARAEKAIISSGNSSIEAAINWLVDHENDSTASETQVAQVPENINIGASNSFHISERVQLKAQELRNQARQRRVDQVKKLEREREKERIRAGKELQEAKRMAEESERRRFLAQRKAEKEEEERARERIRQKLQQDKLERRGMLGSLGEELVPKKPVDTALPQSRKNPQPIKPSKLPANLFAARDQMRECLRSIKRQNKDNYAYATWAFQTLLVYVRNIINNPEEGKFRRIRISNPSFQNRVARYDRGIEFLELCGFERDEGDGFLQLPEEKLDMSRLKSAWTELQNALTNPFFGLFSV